jgi:hypothetical protein
MLIKKKCYYEGCRYPVVKISLYKDIRERPACIFHSHNDNKTPYFSKIIKKHIKDNIEPINCNGFYFPSKIQFNTNWFNKEIEYRDAIFKCDLIYDASQFYKTITGRMICYNTEFQMVCFRNIIFTKRQEFKKCKFISNSFFERVKFDGNVIFSDSDLSKVSLRRATLLNSYLDNIKYNDRTVKEVFIDTFTANTNRVFARKASDYNYLEQRKNFFNDLKNDAKSFKDKWKFFWKKGLFDLWKITCNYGESISKWLFCCAIIILYFTFLYFIMICQRHLEITNNSFGKICDSLYYSFLNFTLIGSKDINFITEYTRWVMILETFIGYFMLGVLIPLATNKIVKKT